MPLNKNTNLSPQISTVQYTLKENIASLEEGSSKFHRIITFEPGYTWEDFYASPTTIKFSELPKETSAGIYYEQELILSFPGEDENNSESIFNLDELGMVVKFTYDNGLIKIFGSKDNPSTMKVNFSSDDNKTASLINFTRKSHYKALILETG